MPSVLVPQQAERKKILKGNHSGTTEAGPILRLIPVLHFKRKFVRECVTPLLIKLNPF